MRPRSRSGRGGFGRLLALFLTALLVLGACTQPGGPDASPAVASSPPSYDYGY